MSKLCYCCRTKLIHKKSASREQLENGRVASEEHILPNFLGGRLSSYELLCRKCNNDFGMRLDGALSNELIISKVILIPIKRGKQFDRMITGKTKEGVEFLVNKDGESIFARPQVITDDDGNIDSVVAFDYEQAITILKEYKQRHPECNIDSFLQKAKFETIQPGNISTIFFDDHTIGSDNFFKGVTKIAINFALYHGVNMDLVVDTIRFISKGGIDNIYSTFYYPINLESIHNWKKDELSHVIYLRGDKDYNILYCYIELFNYANVVVILNHNYNEENFQISYAWDVVNSTELVKNINLKLIYPEYWFNKNIGHCEMSFQRGFEKVIDTINRHRAFGVFKQKS